MLSDRAKHLKSPKKRTADMVNKRYSDNQKLESLKLWLVTGNLRVVSASLEIPYKTLQEWRYSTWWAEMASDIKAEGHLQLSNRLKTIAEKALEVTLDRLENGDFMYDQKTGQVIRKQVTMKDAHVVASSLLDKSLKLQDTPMDEVEKHKVQDTLSALAAAFEQFANKNRKNVIDVEVSDAVHDEWKEKLQEGKNLGRDESHLPEEGSPGEGSGSESGGEEAGQLTYQHAGGP